VPDQDKEVALLGISEAARRAVEGGRGARARMYEGLLKEYRRARPSLLPWVLLRL
jgi:hypothetical protein